MASFRCQELHRQLCTLNQVLEAMEMEQLGRKKAAQLSRLFQPSEPACRALQKRMKRPRAIDESETKCKFDADESVDDGSSKAGFCFNFGQM